MNEFLRKFDTIRFVAPWGIFRNFLDFFIFLNLNLNFEFGPVWYQPKPEPGRTGLTGNRSNRTGSHRFGEPWLGPASKCSERDGNARTVWSRLPPSLSPVLILAVLMSQFAFHFSHIPRLFSLFLIPVTLLSDANVFYLSCSSQSCSDWSSSEVLIGFKVSTKFS